MANVFCEIQILALNYNEVQMNESWNAYSQVLISHNDILISFL